MSIISFILDLRDRRASDLFKSHPSNKWLRFYQIQVFFHLPGCYHENGNPCVQNCLVQLLAEGVAWFPGTVFLLKDFPDSRCAAEPVSIWGASYTQKDSGAIKPDKAL